MQPEPHIYLAGAQKTLLELIERGKVTDPAVVLALRRVAETLAQTTLRRDGLPDVLSKIRPRQQQLLRDTLALMKELGVEPLPSIPDSRATPEEGAIRAYDELGWAASLNLRKLAELNRDASKPGSKLGALLAEGAALEGEARAAYREALAASKKALGVGEGEPPPPPPTPEELEAYLRTQPGARDVKVTNVRQQVGINSKDIIFFDVAGIDGWPTSVVMRKMRGWNANPLISMQHEHKLLNALNGLGVPTPRALAVDPDGSALGHPSIIMEKVSGQAMLPGVPRPEFGVEGGRAVGDKIAKHLARIHSVDVTAVARESEKGLSQREALQQHFGRYYKQWQKVQLEPSITLQQGFSWMLEKLDELDDSFTLVHGDLDFRNIMFEGADVSAVLDWERSHLGHPAEDLAYLRGDIETIMDWDEFVAMYRKHGGKPVTEEALKLFHMWGYLFKAFSATSMALEGYAMGDYDDFLLASTCYIEGQDWLDNARRLLAAG